LTIFTSDDKAQIYRMLNQMREALIQIEKGIEDEDTLNQFRAGHIISALASAFESSICLQNETIRATIMLLGKKYDLNLDELLH
jgi:hypothetical protein